MNKFYLMFFWQIKPFLLTFLALGLTLTNTTLSLAQNQTLSSSLPLSWDFSPPKTGQPDNREGGATRGPEDENQCLSSPQDFIPLIPPSGKGLTSAAYPTFFWFLPPNSGEKLRFTLQNKQGIELYVAELKLNKTQQQPQLMSLKLPSNLGLSPLEIGTEYHWQLTLICNTSNDLDFIRVQANVERIATNSDFISNLKNASLENQVKIYADARLWYDTIKTMLQLRRLQPQNPDLNSAWVSLLHSVGLENFDHVH